MSTIKHANLLSIITKINDVLETLQDDDHRNSTEQYIFEQLEDALALLNEANSDTNEQDEQTPAEQLERIKSEIHDFAELESERISDLCNRLGYQDGSRLSYIIDRIELVESDLNGFEILGR